jgi:pimeloyl-ACP methyl ester carboxylesterase
LYFVTCLLFSFLFCQKLTSKAGFSTTAVYSRKDLMRRLFALMPLLFGMPMAMAAVPVDIHAPASIQACTHAKPCPVAILSPGYGLSGSDYSFVTNYLKGMGYLVVAVRDSAGGVTLDRNAPVSKQVQAMARVASQSISTAIDESALRYPQFDWRHLLLVGHSLGGDSSAQFAADNPDRVSSLVSLDSRRVALPRSAGIHVLTIRASDTTADPGVLPNEEERSRYGSCVVRIEGARHNDMQDAGSEQLKARMTSAIDTFLAPALIRNTLATRTPGWNDGHPVCGRYSRCLQRVGEYECSKKNAS